MDGTAPFWPFRGCWIEAGIFEMYLIFRTPNTTPGAPNCPEVVQIDLGSCDHVESIPVLMGTRAGWRYWILGLPTEKSFVEALLLRVSPEGAGYPGLDASAASEIHELLRRLLETWD